MKTLTALALLLALAPLSLAEMRDPAPVVSEEEGVAPDGRHYAGIFDFARPTRTVCENGVCRTVPAAPASVPTAVFKARAADCTCADPCPCESCGSSAAATVRPFATARQFRPFANLFERVRTWYPGRALSTFRASGGLFGGCR